MEILNENITAPIGIDLQSWYNQRREEITNGNRARPHRSRLHTEVGGGRKVSPHNVMTSESDNR